MNVLKFCLDDSTDVYLSYVDFVVPLGVNHTLRVCQVDLLSSIDHPLESSKTSVLGIIDEEQFIALILQ